MGYNIATEEQEKTWLHIMSSFEDVPTPQVGIFWYDPVKVELFGVLKCLAIEVTAGRGDKTYPKLHKQWWGKRHHSAVARGLIHSPFYGTDDYTQFPRGRVFVREDGTVYVNVGSWIKDVDEDAFREVVSDEFDIPFDFEINVASHWDIGHGWDGDK